MLIKHRNFEPRVDATAYVAPTAVLVGKVRVGAESRILFGAVLDAEGSSVDVGACSIVLENAVIRASATGSAEHPVVIEDHVFISPHTTLLGCKIEQCSYIATGATVVQGAVVGAGAVIAVGAIVHANTIIPRDFFLPPNTVAVGDPVQVYSADQTDAMTKAIRSIGFAKVAFNVDIESKSRAQIYREVTETRAREFGEHVNDSAVPQRET